MMAKYPARRIVGMKLPCGESVTSRINVFGKRDGESVDGMYPYSRHDCVGNTEFAYVESSDAAWSKFIAAKLRAVKLRPSQKGLQSHVSPFTGGLKPSTDSRQWDVVSETNRQFCHVVLLVTRSYVL
jgi:hypothetical protein